MINNQSLIDLNRFHLYLNNYIIYNIYNDNNIFIKKICDC